MRPEAFESVELLSADGEFPIQSLQSTERWSEMIRLVLLAALAGAIVLPQIALAIYALANPETRALILARPLMTAELAVAMAFWIGLFAWPLRRVLARVNGRRKVEITRSIVAVRDEKLLGTITWMAPLSAYKGITHRVRASLSGSRHELVLVHPDASRSVLLLVSEYISDTEIQRFAHLLGLPQIQAQQVYSATIPAKFHDQHRPAPSPMPKPAAMAQAA
jgi:hypothetical protein